MSQSTRIPGPKHLFGFKFIQDFRKDTLNFLLKLHKDHGDVVYARLGPYKAFFFFSPETIKEILVQKVKHLPKFTNQVRVLRQWDGNGLVLSEGEFWARQHRLVQPAFQTKRFEGYVTSMVEKIENLAQRWSGFDSDATFNIEDEMNSLTLAIIAKTLFGADLTSQTSELGKAVAILSETAVREMGEVIRLPNWLPLAKIKKKVWATKYVDSTIRKIISERRKTGEDAGDLLSMLLQAVDSEDSKSQMTDEQARDEAMVLFLAGHDTTASALTWLWYVISRYPEVQKQCYEEIQSVLQGKNPTFYTVSKLSYLTSVIKETLRLYPPAIGIFAREAKEDMEIGGYPVPKNSIVYAFSYVTQRDARYFPDPERFDPSRFSVENEKQISPFVYFPFGVGPRACIGAQFAMTEIAVVATILLQKFEFSLAPKQGEPQFLSLLSLRPKGGIQLNARKRTS